MRVLWITNIVFPEALSILTGTGELKSSGGWMLGAASALLSNSDVTLAVASCSEMVQDLKIIRGNQIIYYILPEGRGKEIINKEFEPIWVRVKDDFKPDVVHLYGTEYSHGLSYINACGSNNVVVSIQGLTSIYARYYYGGLNTWEIIKSISLRDLIKGSLFSGRRSFIKRGKYEIEIIKKTQHFIGRTEWDRAHVWAINPEATYHFCNETLREEFYDGDKWNYNDCVHHSIFASTAGFPIKGFHKILMAMPLVLQEFPDVSIRVAGLDITHRDGGFISRLKRTGYGKYLSKLINNLHLNDHISFTGSLDAEQMKKEYLKANVFICPSSIENSPNSLCEAQILGTPCISSYVGGIADLTNNALAGDMYRFEETEMLAWKICDLFKKSQLFDNTRQIEIASIRHNRVNNTKELIAVYCDIMASLKSIVCEK